MLAVTRKYTSGEHFVEIAHVQPCGLSDDMLARVKQTVFAALDALHIREGAAHTEFKVDSEGEIRLIEAGARMGGDLIGSSLVPMTTGLDYVKMVLDTALGRTPDFRKMSGELLPGRGRAALIRYLFTRKDEELLRRVWREHPEWIACSSLEGPDFGPEGSASVTAAAGEPEGKEELVLPLDSSGRHGFYILRGEDAGELIRAAGL